jgi:hypothetical protein
VQSNSKQTKILLQEEKNYENWSEFVKRRCISFETMVRCWCWQCVYAVLKYKKPPGWNWLLHMPTRLQICVIFNIAPFSVPSGKHNFLNLQGYELRRFKEIQRTQRIKPELPLAPIFIPNHHDKRGKREILTTPPP